MKYSTIACLLGSAAILAAGGVGAVACSSSSGTGTVTPPVDSGKDTNQPTVDTGTPDQATPPSGDSGSDAGCDNPTLHAGEDGGGIYCPFAGDGSTTIYCGAEGGTMGTCCVSGEVGSTYPPSYCATNAAACDFVADGGNTTVACLDPATDCPSGNVCCLTAPASDLTPSPDPATCPQELELHDWRSNACMTGSACPSGTIQICESTSECPGGQTCTPFKAKGVQMGYCAGSSAMDGGAEQ